jgi:PAS domain S-box-containing protein
MEMHEFLPSMGADDHAMLHELGDVLEVGVLVLDRALVVRGWNRWLATASGRDAASVVGRPLFDVFPGLEGGRAESALRRALEGGTLVWSHRFHAWFLPLPAPTGHEQFDRMQQSVRIMPLLQDGEVRGVIAIVQDVTERVAREQELRLALSRAEAASQAKSDFLASMSHELRTPLAAIVGYMDLLDGEIAGPVAPVQKTYLGRVKTAARHLINIIEEILTFSRIEAGKERVHAEESDVAALAQDVEELFEPLARQKGLELRVSRPAEPLLVTTDLTKLRQILINLIGNAIKFTDAGEIELSLHRAGDRVCITIRDTGPGIARDDLERIFDPFTQIDQTLTRSKGGTGLGLPVSRRLAQLLGGDLSVESLVGTGTIFSLTIPCHLESPVFPELSLSRETVPAPPA